MVKVEVKRVGRTYGIFVDGRLVEGGFFSKSAAIDASAQYKAPQPQGR